MHPPANPHGVVKISTIKYVWLSDWDLFVAGFGDEFLAFDFLGGGEVAGWGVLEAGRYVVAFEEHLWVAEGLFHPLIINRPIQGGFNNFEFELAAGNPRLGGTL
jgi:hypothetical protein